LRVDPATPDRISALIARVREQLDDFSEIASGDLLKGGSVTVDTAELLDAMRAATPLISHRRLKEILPELVKQVYG
jgi:hypothetical protein